MNNISIYTEKLRESGLRPTRQRLKICEVLFSPEKTFHFTINDLSKIHELGFKSIASNKIFYAFKETKWRPNYYTISDTLVWGEIKNKIHKEIDIVHVPSFLDDKDCNVIVKTWKNLSNGSSTENRRISNDLSNGAAAGFTVTYENIQLAMHLGLNPIYLIGCDHYYEGENEEVLKKDKLVKHTNKNTHFISNYRKLDP